MSFIQIQYATIIDRRGNIWKKVDITAGEDYLEAKIYDQVLDIGKSSKLKRLTKIEFS